MSFLPRLFLAFLVCGFLSHPVAAADVSVRVDPHSVYLGQPFTVTVLVRKCSALPQITPPIVKDCSLVAVGDVVAQPSMFANLSPNDPQYKAPKRTGGTEI